MTSRDDDPGAPGRIRRLRRAPAAPTLGCSNEARTLRHSKKGVSAPGPLNLRQRTCGPGISPRLAEGLLEAERSREKRQEDRFGAANKLRRELRGRRREGVQGSSMEVGFPPTQSTRTYPDGWSPRVPPARVAPQGPGSAGSGARGIREREGRQPQRSSENPLPPRSAPLGAQGAARGSRPPGERTFPGRSPRRASRETREGLEANGRRAKRSDGASPALHGERRKNEANDPSRRPAFVTGVAEMRWRWRPRWRPET
jgi:hypothetical protein